MAYVDESGVTTLTNEIKSYIQTYFLDLHYPVGSIYLSVNSTSPATLFGGTWEQIQDKFLLSAGSDYTAGDTGGEANYTADDMPAHTHTRGTMDITGMIRCYSEFNKGNSDYDVNGVSGAFYFKTGTNTEYGTSTNMSSGSNDAIRNVQFQASKAWTGNTSQSGTNETVTIMPPYLVVYMWKRVE